MTTTVARLLTNSFKRMLIISTSIGAAAGLVGLYLSYHPDISSGATIVLVNFVLFAVAYAYAYSAAKSTSHRPLATLKFARRADVDPVANSSVVLPAEITLDTPQQ